MINPKITKLLELMDEQTKETSLHQPQERALWHLLKCFEDRLPDLDDYFHKAFRQVDVTGSGHTDMAIWCLLGNSVIFWRLFEQSQDEKPAKESQP